MIGSCCTRVACVYVPESNTSLRYNDNCTIIYTIHNIKQTDLTCVCIKWPFTLIIVYTTYMRRAGSPHTIIT